MDKLDENLKNDRRFVTALARGLEILNCFHPEEGRLGNGQIAERTGLPKATVARLTFTLSCLGYLTQSAEDSKYSHGPALINMGYIQLGRMRVRRIARPLMLALAEYSQGSVNFAFPDGLSLTYIDTYRSAATLNLQLEAGSRIPIIGSAMGRAYMSVVSEGTREELYERIRDDYRENWQSIEADLEEARVQYQEKGYCLSLGGWRKENNSVAVPLMVNETKSGITLFSCGGPSFLFTHDKLENDIAPRLLHLVSNVATALEAQGGY